MEGVAINAINEVVRGHLKLIIQENQLLDIVIPSEIGVTPERKDYSMTKFSLK